MIPQKKAITKLLKLLYGYNNSIRFGMIFSRESTYRAM